MTVSPSELYFFRMLLLKFPLRSYAEAKVVDGATYETFCEAAKALGLITDELEYLDCLVEAATFRNPSRNIAVPSLPLIGCFRAALPLLHDPHCPRSARSPPLERDSGRTLHDEGSPQRLPDANELYQAFPPARTTRRRPSGS